MGMFILFYFIYIYKNDRINNQSIYAVIGSL